jgi:hypothetical protein
VELLSARRLDDFLAKWVFIWQRRKELLNFLNQQNQDANYRLWRRILMQEYENLKTLVAEIEADINKAEGGNKAAGTRVRKQMQQIKQAAQLVRNRVLEIRAAE